MFYHDTIKARGWVKKAKFMRVNDADHEAGLFSRFADLRKYYTPSTVAELIFRLSWPGTSLESVIWGQKSDPTNETRCRGFHPIFVPTNEPLFGGMVACARENCKFPEICV